MVTSVGIVPLDLCLGKFERAWFCGNIIEIGSHDIARVGLEVIL